MQAMQATKTSTLQAFILCAFFAALTAICSAISIPLPFSPIPLNLATLSVMLAGLLLGPGWGSLSQLVYALLGAIGLPVFHSFTSGFGILLGPTGGYILGYIAAAAASGFVFKNFFKANKNIVMKAAVAAAIGCILCYSLGTLWFMFLTKAGLAAALVSCVIPFLPGDVLKILAAATLTKRLHSFIL